MADGLVPDRNEKDRGQNPLAKIANVMDAVRFVMGQWADNEGMPEPQEADRGEEAVVELPDVRPQELPRPERDTPSETPPRPIDPMASDATSPSDFGSQRDQPSAGPGQFNEQLRREIERQTKELKDNLRDEMEALVERLFAGR